jgi:hypothetical protein
LKKNVTILGMNEGTDFVKYIHGNYGKGTFTLYAGHDPEDYQHVQSEIRKLSSKISQIHPVTD